ncbi:MAG: cupin domain-containing protein [Flavobacteriaceae bacterium]|nr:cupin domain-containing protein [Flavobacteriaceae bacterium]
MKSIYYFIFATLVVILFGCGPKNKLPDPLEAGWEGEKVCEVLEENEHVRVLKCTFPPGVGHEKHFHPRHFGYTLVGGKMKIEDDEGVREVDIPTGFSFYNESIKWHQVENIGDSTSVYLIVEPK